MSKLKQIIREEIQKVLSKTPTIELNTSFLQSQDDFERGGDEGYTVWKPEFKNGLKANQQNFTSSGKSAIPVQKIKFEQGFNEEPIKLELYNFFKSFNDKWVAGNSLGQRLLIEEFMFLDKRNSDIGDKAFLGLDRLLPLDDEKNSKQNLYSTISMLIQGTGFDMRPMPAYVNFYGTNYNNKSKVTSSKVTANNLFGTFLDVDYQDSSPKIVLQYTGPTSKYTDMSEVSRDKFKFRDDSFYIGSTVDNPIIIDNGSINRREDLFKSNKKRNSCTF